MSIAAKKLPTELRRIFGSVRNRQPHVTGRMNQLEVRYAIQLDVNKIDGEIVDYWFEEHKFRLADRTWYTPDFVVVMDDGSIEVHEVKGFWRDDARVKWKATAEKFWWLKFVAVTWKKKRWQFEEYRG